MESTTVSVALDASELVAALADAGVDYILIGGFAVGAHGHVRATKDLDIVPSSEFGNLERLAALLRELGATLYGTGDFDPNEFPFDPLDPSELAEGGNFLLITKHGRLDVMQWVPGIDAEHAFEHLRASAIETTLGGRRVLVCSRQDLIAMKQAAGRPQDLEDLRALGA
jgi:predicted nucleotidyltransferase